LRQYLGRHDNYARRGAHSNKHRVHHRAHFLLGWTTGLGWWHHYTPPVVGTMRGAIGLRWRWLEVALVVGSPAWGRWSKTGLYEIGIRVGLRLARWGRLALVHRITMGAVLHNPPLEFHSLLVRLAPAVLAYRLWRGAWLEVSLLTFTSARLEQLETTAGLRYEF